MKSVFHADVVLAGALVGTIASASPPMHPGAGSAIVEAWNQSDAAQTQRGLTQSAGSATRSNGTDWMASDWMSNRIIEQPLYGENYGPDEESDVTRRVRELQEEANQRWHERRVDSDTAVGGDWYPEQAGWISPEGKPDAANWPWWLF